MSKHFSIAILIIILGAFIIPQVVSAAILPFDFGNDSIVPCGTSTTPACTLCYFFKGIQNIIKLSLSLVILIAPLIIIYGGFVILSSAGRPEKVTLGKSIITYVIIGLMIVFGAWLIINTVINGLVGSNKNLSPWNKIECDISGGAPGKDNDNDNGNGNGNEEDREGLNKDTCAELDPSIKEGVGWCMIGSIGFWCNSGIQSQLDNNLVSSDIQSLILTVQSALTSPFSLGPDEGKRASRVSSLSDNSLGQCTKNWIGHCTGTTDSCGGTCCAHRQNSDHYCNGKSYAVDFGEQKYAYEICNAVLAAVKEKGAFILKEGNHVHVGMGKEGNCPGASAYNISKAVCDKMK